MKNETPELLAELHDMLTYDANTGILRWKNPTNPRRVKAGDIAGCVSHTEKGRVLLGLRGKLHKAHRIAWAMHYGKWPKDQIDHINECPSDNRICNLREANKSENMRNITRIRSNTSGHKGVAFYKDRWVARIKLHGKDIYIGRYEKLEDAILAYQKASPMVHGEYGKF